MQQFIKCIERAAQERSHNTDTPEKVVSGVRDFLGGLTPTRTAILARAIVYYLRYSDDDAAIKRAVETEFYSILDNAECFSRYGESINTFARAVSYLEDKEV